MINFVFVLLFCSMQLFAAGPIYQHSDNPASQREYQELYLEVKKAQTTANTAITSSSNTIPSGSIVLFMQSSCPDGWTKITSQNDKFIRIVSGTGGGTGGTNAASTGLSHTHTVPDHRHSIQTTSVSDASGSLSYAYLAVQGVSGTGFDLGVYSNGGATNRDVMQSRTAIDGNTTTGTTAPTFQYVDILACSKN